MANKKDTKLIELSKREVEEMMLEAKYLKALDTFNVNITEDIYKKVLSIIKNIKQVKDVLDIHTNLVLDTEASSKYNFNISKNNFKLLKDYLEGSINRYQFDSSIAKSIHKIKVNIALENNIDLEKLNGIDRDELIDYVVSNRSELIDTFKIYHTMIEKTGIIKALNYIDTNIKPLIMNYTSLKDVHADSNIKVLDFIEKTCNLSEETYNLKVYDSREANSNLIEAAMNFGRDIAPYEVWSYTSQVTELYDEKKHLLQDELYDDELYDELIGDEEAQMRDDFTIEMNYLLRSDLEVAKINEYDSPFLKERYFKNLDNIGDLSILDDMECYGFEIGFICTHSKKIDLFIKNNIENNDNLNKLLMNVEELYSIYCDSCYTMSAPKIITKESGRFPEYITSEYLIISTTFYNAIMDNRLDEHELSKKIMSSTDYKTIKSIFNANEKLVETIL